MTAGGFEVAQAQDALDRICASHEIPGAVLGVVEGEDVTAVVSGIANLNTGLPVVRGTLFQAGSTGKSYTATAAMQLVDDGQLDLDAPLRDYLPDLEFADPDVSKSLTSRQVLTHTAGIDGDALDQAGACGRGDDCLERFVATLRDLPVITEPGGLWSYCNSGYVVLGRVIEVVTGKTYEQALTTQLLEPLGLKDTLFFPGDMVTHSLAVGHLPARAPRDQAPARDVSEVRAARAPAVAPRWEMSRAGGPAGATINTTIDDLLAFAQMHLRGGVAADSTRILSESSVRAMQHPYVACPDIETLGNGWGMGWFVRTGAGPTVIGHDGNTFGLTSCLRLIPERNAAWALLMNLAGQNRAGMEIGQSLIDPWLGTITPAWPQPRARAELDPGPFIGTYRNVRACLTVTANDGELSLDITAAAGGERNSAMRGQLLPIDGPRFVLRIAALGGDVPVTFLQPDNAGDHGYLQMSGRLYRNERRA